MSLLHLISHYISYQRYLFCLLLILALASCGSPNTSFVSYDDRVKIEMRAVNYEDGISSKDAGSIANAYLYLHARYKGRALFARVKEGKSEWLGKVYAIQSAAILIDPELPPLIINKSTGAITWKYGPAVARIDMTVLENAPLSRSTIK